MASIKGIDISHWQGNPDFARAKAAGIRYVIIKATEGVDYVDPCFTANIKAALAAGLPVGAYHFLRTTPLEQQAADFLAAIKPYKLTWPAALDVEHAELTGMGRDKLTDMVLGFCARVKSAGYQPLVYSNYNWLYDAKCLDAGRIRAAGVPLWMAWYSNAAPENTDRSSLCDIWQYASDGSVDGISGNVDCNVSYRDFAAAPAPSYTCDTAGTVEIARGAAYQVEITAPNAPKIVAGTPDVVTILPRSNGEGKWYYYIVPIGKRGDLVGIYINGGPRQFIVEVK
jgi:lysozyme